MNLKRKTKQINEIELFSYTSVHLYVILNKCINILPSNVMTLDIFCQVCSTRKSLLTLNFETIKINCN